MKFLALLITCLCLPCFAQFPYSGVEWTAPASGGGGDIVTQQGGMAYYWNFLDVATNNKVPVWPDRIKGVNLVQDNTSAQPTNSLKGIRFNSDGAAWLLLTNKINLMTNSVVTNILMYTIFIWDGGGTGSTTLIADTNNPGDDGNLYVRIGSNKRLQEDLGPLGTVAFWPSISTLAVPTGVAFDAEFHSLGTGSSTQATNGVTYTQSIPNIFTNFTTVGKNLTVGVNPWNGYLAVLAFYTNTLVTATLASNLHWFKTNVPPQGLGLTGP